MPWLAPVTMATELDIRDLLDSGVSFSRGPRPFFRAAVELQREESFPLLVRHLEEVDNDNARRHTARRSRSEPRN
jgi:hypothetical protein